MNNNLSGELALALSADAKRKANLLVLVHIALDEELHRDLVANRAHILKPLVKHIAANGEEAAHGVREARQRSGQNAGTPRDDAAVDGPVLVNSNILLVGLLGVARAEHVLSPLNAKGAQDLRDGLWGVLEISIHHHHVLATALVEAVDNSAAQTALRSADKNLHIVPLRAKGLHLFDRAVAAIIVDNKHLDASLGEALRLEGSKDAAGELINIASLLVGGDNDAVLNGHGKNIWCWVTNQSK